MLPLLFFLNRTLLGEIAILSASSLLLRRRRPNSSEFFLFLLFPAFFVALYW
jgi:hypothetical protein